MRETEKLLQERGLNKLTSQQKDLLKGQTEGITSSDHTVFNLISKYAKLVSPSLHRVSPALNPSICHLIISTYHGFNLGVFGPNKALLTGCGLRGPTVSDYLFLDWTLQFFLRTLSRKLNSNHHQDIGASSKTLVLPANPELLFRKNRLNLQRSPSNLKSFFFILTRPSFYCFWTATRTYDFMFNSIKRRFLQKGSRESGQSTQPSTPQGLTSVNTELSEITGRFSRVVGHNLAVFVPFYEDLLTEIKGSWQWLLISTWHL